MKFVLEHVERFPKALLPGKLYYSKEFKTSRHLCACGCGDVIKLPIDHLHHRISQGANGPTLRPSVGNWNVCDAHYLITDGRVEWCGKWSQEQISAGRTREDQRRELYFKMQDTLWQRVKRAAGQTWSAIRGFLRRT